MDKKYTITILKWVLYKFYAGISEALAVYQLIEADYSLDNHAGNIKAISDYLHFICNAPASKILTSPDAVHEDHINRNPRKGIIYKALYNGADLHVEIKHPRYNRSRVQLDLEDRIHKTAGIYLVVDGFTDLLQQMIAYEVGKSQPIQNTS